MIEAYEVLDLQTNRVKISKVKQAAVAYADDTTWVAKSKKKMQKKATKSYGY